MNYVKSLLLLSAIFFFVLATTAPLSPARSLKVPTAKEKALVESRIKALKAERDSTVKSIRIILNDHESLYTQAASEINGLKRKGKNVMSLEKLLKTAQSKNKKAKAEVTAFAQWTPKDVSTSTVAEFIARKYLPISREEDKAFSALLEGYGVLKSSF